MIEVTAGEFATRSRKTLVARAAVVVLLSLACAAVFAGQASAAVSRPLLKTLKFGDGRYPAGIATDSAGNIYVNFRVDPAPTGLTEKFDSEGNPVDFTFVAPYIEGNKLLGRPPAGNPGEAFQPNEFDSGTPNGVAVDSSGGPNNGYIYVNNFLFGDGGGSAWAYKPSGEYVGSINGGLNGFTAGCQVRVNQANGNVFVGTGSSEVHRFLPEPSYSATLPDATANTGVSTCAMAVDEEENLYSIGGGEYPSGGITKTPGAAFNGGSPSTEISPGPFTWIAYGDATDHLIAGDGTDLFEMTNTGAPLYAPYGGLDFSRGVSAAPGDRVVATSTGTVAIFGPPANLPVDTTEPATEVLQNDVILNGKTDPDGSGPITKCEFQWGKDSRYLGGSIPCTQVTPYASPTTVSAHLTGLTMNTDYRYRLVTTSAGGKQTGHDVSFRTADYVAEVKTGSPEPFTKNSATLHGSYRGQGLDTDYYFEIGKDTTYGQKFPTSPANAGIENGPQEVDPILATGLLGETEYHYRLVMQNSLGTAVGDDRTFVTPPAVTDLETGGVTNVTNTTAELNGSFTGDSLQVHYFFEWGPTTQYGSITPVEPGNTVAPGAGHVDVPPVLLDPLQEGGIYHYRIVATNSAGKTIGQDRVFKTAEPPQVSNLASKNVKTQSGDLTAEINPNRGETTWYFEWGLTTDYGQKATVAPGTIPAGSDPVPVEVHLDNLIVGQTYHFRLVATNQFGTRRTGDQSFGFYPPLCPNSQLRQETNSSHVPDCRGYELVSPGNANGTTIEPLNGPTTGYSGNPPRVAYGASYGEISGSGEALISVADLYVATRSATHWTSKYVGKTAKETTFMAGPPHGQVYGTTGYGGNNTYFGAATDRTLSRVVLFDLGYPAFAETIDPASNTPYVFDTTTNKQLAQWPTNIDEVPGGESFVGWQAFSEDLTHFVFSSNISFADNGEEFPAAIQCCSWDIMEFELGRCCPGPIYDNNTVNGDIGLISLREDDTRFKGVPVKVSSDGSRVLMSETADWLADFPTPLYMRYGGHTYDIADRAKVQYVNMTDDGSAVYFTAKGKLTPEDQDESLDLYVWNDDDPTDVTLVSKGITGNEGNRDNCKLEWVENCDIQYIDVNSFIIAGQSNGNMTGNETTDTSMGRGTGDIYFVSPEQLDGARGSFGQANIYLYHDGDLRFVVSAEPESCIGRRPYIYYAGNCDAGKISRMQVTPDGQFAGFISRSRLTPYDNNGKAELYVYDRDDNRLDCASCRPDGQPPSFDAFGSQNGLFLTLDGRAFFSTDEPIAPSDTNKGNDVYEFVEGKPQLITTGTGEPASYTGFQGELTAPGLVSVSADGTDVFFATQESLVTQDHNGDSVKLYDARTNGGFPADRIEPECEAADECHGADTSPPAPPKDRTSAPLEGNPKQPGRKGKSAKKRKKAKKAKKHKKHRKAAGGKGGHRAG